MFKRSKNLLHYGRQPQKQLLKNGGSPEIFIVEYNGKFPPPLQFTIAYNEAHIWQGDDYHGASLMSFVKLFEEYNYKLVCCNAETGTNAFFVKAKHMSKFPEVPDNIQEIFSPPHLHVQSKHGHKISIKTIEAFLDKE